MSVMTTLILVAAGLVGATGLILGLFLGVASEKFKVEVDEREAEVRAALPGSNCGACVKACPKSLIALVPYKKKHIVSCKNLLKGKQVKDACSIGCIACGICEKNCPFDAIHVLDNLAVMNEKCTDCGICAQKCPTSAITGKRVKKPEVKQEVQAEEKKAEASASV